MHANGFTMALRCRGIVQQGEYEFVTDDETVTCLWCVAGKQESWLRWVKRE